MGIRTGAQVLEGFRDGRELYMDGERVADVTKDPRLAGGARTMAQLYDMQHENGAWGWSRATTSARGSVIPDDGDKTMDERV